MRIIFFSKKFIISKQIYLQTSKLNLHLKGSIQNISSNLYAFKFSNHFEAYNIHNQLFSNLPSLDKVEIIKNFHISKFKYLEHTFSRKLLESKIKKYSYIKILEPKPSSREHVIVGKSKIISNLRKEITTFTKTSKPILIYGTNSSGKKLFAQVLLEESKYTVKDTVSFDFKTQSLVDIKSILPTKFKVILIHNLDHLESHFIFELMNLLKNQKTICISRTNKFKHLFTQVVQTPSLNQIKNDIIIIFQYFLLRYNQKYSSSLFFESKILEIINEYQWENIKELREFTLELCSTYKFLILKTEFVTKLLSQRDSNKQAIKKQA